MEALAAPRTHRLPASPKLLGLAGDERLVALIRDGSEAAFEAVYERYHRPLLSFCRHMLANSDDAAEAVQHTFLHAYREIVATEKPIQLRPWLFTIARNRSLSMLRARRDHADVDVVEPATEGLAAEVQRREDLREIVGDLARLPDDQRAALVLSELGALDHEEIAHVLDCPRERVKALVYQARTSLAANRDARSIPCGEIREQLANVRGAALRRGPLRKHLRACSGCREFRDEVRRQRQAFALILPVVPVAGLKQAVLSGVGIGGGAGGGAAAGGLSALGGGLAVKAAIVTAIVGGGAVGGVVVAEGIDGNGSARSHAGSKTNSSEGTSGIGAAVVSAISGVKANSSSAAAAAAAAAGAKHHHKATHSSSHGNSSAAHELALSRGQGLKHGLTGTQPSRSDTAPGHQTDHGGSNAGGSATGGSNDAPPGNAYGHDKEPAGNSGGGGPPPQASAPDAAPQAEPNGGNGRGPQK
jgi:RNA polymerase sigma factor (sigma-70 family)